MTNLGFDPFWRWLGLSPPSEDPPGSQMPDDTTSDATSSPWWGLSTGSSAVPLNMSQPYFPWLRAPADIPGFWPNPRTSAQTGRQDGDLRLMANALAPIEPQEQPNDVGGFNGPASGDVRLMAGALAPIAPQEEPNDVTGSDGVASSNSVAPSLPVTSFGSSCGAMGAKAPAIRRT